MQKRGAVGVADHAGWAVLVTVSADGELVDRRRVELVEAGLPCLPHHHEAQELPADQAIALVERVRQSALRCARASLEALSAALPFPVDRIAIRECPRLPETVMERIRDYRSQCVADTVMFRHALADAASARGWAVSWYDRKRVLAPPGVEERLTAVGKAAGRPWTQDHRAAMAAAVAHLRS